MTKYRRLASAGLTAIGAALIAIGLTAQTSPCAGMNPVTCENTKTGNPASEWDIVGVGDGSIQGFATDISVNRGEVVKFKVKTTASSYRLDIYRLGYYAGLGARKVASVAASGPQNQPACLSDASTGLIDCGNWTPSASWTVPADATSGIYVVKLVRNDTGGASHMVFVVRDDTGHSSLLFQASDTTWQAYNNYGGNSLYVGNPVGRAYKVSYNRPFATRTAQNGLGNLSWVFGSEYPMIRWLEANGYDVSYSTGVDTDRRGAELLEHKVFLSVGHDEYWSGAQRTAVEAARAAGVHLAFFSGNEIFWKTRWENSIDGSGTTYRTLVSYKETHANAKIDPSSAWTGTWRDPRFSPPADGGRPENGLSGTMFVVNCCPDDPMTVSAADGKLRLWRNTTVATQSPGASTSFAGMLGHEWDIVPDNGSRPAGLMTLSSTTYQVPSLLLDYGTTYGPGTATHTLALYRHSSGALVFSAGTIQWPWLLDANHDGGGAAAPDVRIQQATVNLLADMGTQPTTLRAGLVTASPSQDLTPPSSAITYPTQGLTVQSGSALTVTGTAADTGGGRVGGVEVSVDGGTSWHPATGRETWSYGWTPSATGPVTIRSRAVDDSGNLQTPGASVNITVGPRVCPCSLWSSSVTPGVVDSGDGAAYELGVRFTTSVDGYVTAVRYYKSAANTGTHVGSLWGPSGTLLASATFTQESSSGWQQVDFPSPVPVTAGVTYTASYFDPNGHYSGDTAYFASSGVNNAPLSAPAVQNGVFKPGTSGFPSSTYNSSNYWVDVVFSESTASDVTPPTVVSVSPATGTAGVPPAVSPSATFSENLAASTVNATTVQLRQGSNGPLVSAAISFNSSTHQIVITPAANLAYATTYVATIQGGASGVADLAGNRLQASYTWSFTTAAQGACPCSLWDVSVTPAVIDSGDPAAYELGVRFSSAIDGYVTAVRFYKSQANTGTHVGHLWSPNGTLLASATFTQETSSGWQQVSFASPIPVSAGLTYTASYFVPNGHYSGDTAYFASAGVNNYPLSAPAVQNGVFTAGSSAFPTSTYNSSNYWVDVVFTAAGAADTTPPKVVSVTPANGATGVHIGTTLLATFDEILSPATVNSTTVQLRQGAGGPLVSTAVSFDDVTRQISIDPVANLLFGTTYVATIQGGASGVADPAGNRLAATYSWSVTTAPQGACPCSLWGAAATPAVVDSGDPGAYELGVRFTTSVDGYITAVRFYKSQANTGTHVGHLWASDGTLLGTATFTQESGSGWQQATFATSVPVTAGLTYTASYYAPSGHYAGDSGYFAGGGVDAYPLWAPAGQNGVYRAGSSGFPTSSYNSSNYWVDVVFDSTGAQTTQTIGDTTAADFGAGAPAAGVYIGETANGELLLTPTVGAEFGGALLPADWGSLAWASGGAASVAGGQLIVDGARANTNALFGPGAALEFVATFRTAGYQHVGLGITFNENPYVSFSTGSGGALYALSGDGSASNSTPLGATLLHAPHRYRIEWNGSSITFLVDGGVVATHAIAIATNMRPIASDYYPAGDVLTVDWLRMSPYALSGTFTSRVLDAGKTTAWGAATWTSAAPTGTSLAISARFGNTATPDGTWTAFSTIAAQGGALSQTSRYVQYRAVLSSTTSAATPALNDITFTGTSGTATQPAISIADLSLNEGNSGTTNAVLTLTLSAASTSTITVNYATADGTATAGSDYVAKSGTATFAPNTTATTVAIVVNGDTVVEPDETFVVNLTSPVNATIAKAQATVTVLNDELPQLTIGNRTVTEGNSGSVSALFTVTLSPASSSTVTVKYATANGTATAGSDYTATSGTLTFPAGTTTQTITVPVLGDTLDEANETFLVTLSAPVNAALGAPSQGTGTITDDDPTPSLVINNVSVTEGNTGTVTATFTVTLSAASGQTVTVNYATANGTATAGSDYVATAGTLTFAPGTTTRTIAVSVIGDLLDENNETFNVNLSGATNATIADSQGVGTIVDNDPTPSLAINNVSVTEGNSGTKNVTFTVTLSAASGRTVTVNYATANGSAVSGSDYVAKSGTLTFAAGVTTQTFTVAIVGNTTKENTETFVVNLSGATNATIADSQGVCTIFDND